MTVNVRCGESGNVHDSSTEHHGEIAFFHLIFDFGKAQLGGCHSESQYLGFQIWIAFGWRFRFDFGLYFQEGLVDGHSASLLIEFGKPQYVSHNILLSNYGWEEENRNKRGDFKKKFRKWIGYHQKSSLWRTYYRTNRHFEHLYLLSLTEQTAHVWIINFVCGVKRVEIWEKNWIEEKIISKSRGKKKI